MGSLFGQDPGKSTTISSGNTNQTGLSQLQGASTSTPTLPAYLQSAIGQAVNSATNTATGANPLTGINQQTAGWNPQQWQAASDLGGIAGVAPQGGINAGTLNTQSYMSPYLNDVVNSTNAALSQQFGQQGAANDAQAAQMGAFGGDRAVVAKANQNYLNNMTMASTDSNLLNSGYQQAQNTALSAANANQNAALNGAQAYASDAAQLQSTQQNAMNNQYSEAVQNALWPEQGNQYLSGILAAVPYGSLTSTANTNNTNQASSQNADTSNYSNTKYIGPQESKTGQYVDTGISLIAAAAMKSGGIVGNRYADGGDTGDEYFAPVDGNSSAPVMPVQAVPLDGAQAAPTIDADLGSWNDAGSDSGASGPAWGDSSTGIAVSGDDPWGGHGSTFAPVSQAPSGGIAGAAPANGYDSNQHNFFQNFLHNTLGVQSPENFGGALMRIAAGSARNSPIGGALAAAAEPTTPQWQLQQAQAAQAQDNLAVMRQFRQQMAQSGGNSGIGGNSLAAQLSRAQVMMSTGNPQLIAAGRAIQTGVLAQLEHGTTFGENGSVVPLPGFNATLAAQKGSVKGAEENAALPAALAKQQAEIAAQTAAAGPRAAATAAAEAPYKPTTVTVPDPDNPGSFVQKTISAAQFARGAQPAQSDDGAISPQQYAGLVTQSESGGNPDAQSPTSSAGGLGQFTDGTWLNVVRKIAPDATQNLTDKQVLALKANPDLSRAATVAYAQQNAPTLMSAGMPVNSGTLALAHHFGPQGAVNLLKAAPLTPVSDTLLGQQGALAANPEIGKLNAGQIVQNTMQRFGTNPVTFGGSPQAPAGPQTGGFRGPPVLTPQQEADLKVQTEERTKEAAGYGDQSASIIKASAGADSTLQKVQILRNAAAQFRPGASGQLRIDSGKALVDTLQTIGIDPPSWLTSATAGGETIGKEGMALTTEIAKALGSREAASVIQSIRQNLPNVNMSQGGFDIILNGVQQGVQRDKDLGSFRENWMQTHKTWASGQNAFDQSNPPEAYASRVVPFPRPANLSNLKPNVFYRAPSGRIGLWDGKTMQPVSQGQ